MHTVRVLKDKETCVLIIFNGIVFTLLMTMGCALPALFKEAYHLSELHIGLCYITNGIGCVVGTLIPGNLTDWNYARHAARLGMPVEKKREQDLSNFPLERVRLQIALPGLVLGIIGIITFGWTVKYQTHIAGPEIAIFCTAMGITTASQIANTLILDLRTDQPATATAAINLVRCLLSAAGAAGIIPLCSAVNPGWAFTILAILLFVQFPIVIWVMNNGMRWRAEAAADKMVKESKANY